VPTPLTWPVLKSYTGDHLLRVALPLGGIGTGTISLAGRGNLQDWEVMNRPAKGCTPRNAFFVLRVKEKGKPPVLRCLEGRIHPSQYEGASGSTVPNHGLPRFRSCRYHAAYPLAQVELSDPDVPVEVRLEAFNPLIPNDPDRSGIPVAVLRYSLHNLTRQPLDVALCGSFENFVGNERPQPASAYFASPSGMPRNNANEYRAARQVCGIFMTTRGVAPASEQYGSLALAAIANTGVTYRTSWAKLSWGDSLLDFWDDLAADGRLDDRDQGAEEAPTGSLAVALSLPPGESRSVTFLIAWHFPNRMTWTPQPVVDDGTIPLCGCATPGCGDPNWVGNYYATRYADAWDVIVRTAPDLPALEDDSVRFVRALVDSTFPTPVIEAALFNLSTLRSQTSFRTADGRFLGWEGCSDLAGCCHGSCTHVWNYEQATAFLFGSLAWSMREVEFAQATDGNGKMSFRVNLPLLRATEWETAAADGQMGCIMKLYRDWQLSGDDRQLHALWPHARRALEFCWVPGGWDADRDGVMEGCQHNTMDVEYYGPNPQMGSWYLGALRAGEEMARYLGEAEFADECRRLFDRGSRWLDQHLFNGEYYEHEIRPPLSAAAIALGLRHSTMGARNLADPELQLGAGCLVDQLVGQFMAHVCGLGYLLAPEHVTTTYDSLMKYNFKADFSDHFNHMRSYVLNDESAMLMASYPRGRRPARPFPYYNEVMTGFEYTAAVGMLYEGQIEQGLRVVKAVRDRYDGYRRNPFDEAECGHHYARAMASWAALLALSGFGYSAVARTLTLAPRWRAEDFSSFWSVPAAWGAVRQAITGAGMEIRWRVLSGALPVRRLRFRPPAGLSAAPTVTLDGHPLSASAVVDDWVEVELAEELVLGSGAELAVCIQPEAVQRSK
jgi:non-lysosomal glucosylceramidase